MYCELRCRLEYLEENVEVLREGEECSYCHFAALKRRGDEIICPVCCHGHMGCT
jgi:hypothetical protein